MPQSKPQRRTLGSLHKNDGVAMVIVLCASALFLALAAALVWSASAMMASANRQMAGERAYQLAQSFSQVLAGELTDEDKTESSFRAAAAAYLADPTTEDKDCGSAQNDAAYGKVNILLKKAGLTHKDLVVAVTVSEVNNEEFTYTLRYTCTGGVFKLKGAQA